MPKRREKIVDDSHYLAGNAVVVSITARRALGKVVRASAVCFAVVCQKDGIVPLRVTFVLRTADLSGGVRVIATYAKRLSERGHSVTVVSALPPRGGAIDLLRNFIRGRSQQIAGRRASHLDGVDGVRFELLSSDRSVTAGDVPDADVVIATWWETAEWIAAFPLEKGRKFHLVQGYEVFPYTPEARVRAVYRLPLIRVAVSNWVAEKIRSDGADNVHTVLNGVDQSIFRSPPRNRQSKFTVGLVYNSMAIKNSGLALQSLRQFDDLSDVRVVSFGAEEIQKEHYPLTRSFQYYKRPSASQIRSIYGQCDAWLFTSNEEGFGLPILEAMACRTPVIATRAGAAPDLINGKNGRLVDWTAGSINTALDYYARLSAVEWQSQSEAAYQTATENNWDRATIKLERILLGEDS